MTEVDNVLAFNAFEKQLRTLCLTEFPCGTGTWREKETVPREFSKQNKNKTPQGINLSRSRVSSKFSVTLKDFGAKFEKTETLEEYVTELHSPWNLDYSWSSEAKQLRELAVRSPWMISERFIYDYFKTLRIIDKNVTEVDPALLNFTNLDELTLTCNLLQQVNSKNLPKKLTVLELCANKITDLFTLCVDPPKLNHLGLGYNSLSYLDEYITGDYWPELLSLDLSHNCLCDLLDLIKKLSTLPKLRNLVLMGNPLCLIPGYRGYTIDSLRKLNILDDIRISADEKHKYKGLSKKREFVLDEAKFLFEVKFLKGLPIPEEIKNAEEQPEFPVIERKYYVQFMFVEDSSAKRGADVYEIIHHEHGSSSPTLESTTTGTRKDIDRVSESETDGGTFKAESIPEVHVYSPTGEQRSPALDKEIRTLPDDFERVQSGQLSRPESVQQDGELDHQIAVSPVQTDKHPWADEIELNWLQAVSRDDLATLKDFLKQGMEFSIIEEKILSYPAEDGSTDEPVKSGKEKDKKDKKDKKEDKGKDKDKGGKDDKKKKGKKGEPDMEMVHMPPEVTTIATFMIPLDDFLEGEHEFQNVYIKESANAGAKTPESMGSVDKKEGKKDKDGRDKKSAAVGKKKEDKKEKEGRKSPKGKDDKKADKGKGKDKQGTDVGDVEDDSFPPPPLEIQVSVRLHYWREAMDLVRDEEEKARQRALKEAQEAEEAAADAAIA